MSKMPTLWDSSPFTKNKLLGIYQGFPRLLVKDHKPKPMPSAAHRRKRPISKRPISVPMPTPYYDALCCALHALHSTCAFPDGSLCERAPLTRYPRGIMKRAAFTRYPRFHISFFIDRKGLQVSGNRYGTSFPARCSQCKCIQPDSMALRT